VCFLYVISKTTRIYGLVVGNGCKLEEGGSHQTIATTPDLKRNLEASRHDGSTQLIHIQVGQCGMPFYKLLHKADGFQWDDQAAAVLVKLKQYLKSLTTMVPPQPDDILLRYMAATDAVVSTIIIMEWIGAASDLKQ
jgi:hypothetical protein